MIPPTLARKTHRSPESRVGAVAEAAGAEPLQGAVGVAVAAPLPRAEAAVPQLGAVDRVEPRAQLWAAAAVLAPLEQELVERRLLEQGPVELARVEPAAAVRAVPTVRLPACGSPTPRLLR